jgi:hypothetical protein
MKKILAIVLLLLSLNTYADSREWTRDEKSWGAAAGTLLLADWSTTHNMTHRYNEGYYEKYNLLLGPTPSAEAVNLYFLTVTPAVFLAADYFSNYRKEILRTTSLIEIIMVGYNLRIGLKIQF